MMRAKEFLVSASLFALSAPAAVSVVQDVPGYNSWPMTQAIGRRIVCAYSRGSAHTIDEPVRGVFAKTSDDGGRTWSAETTVANDPVVGEVTEGIGLGPDGAALMWVRCWGAPKDRHHDVYRTADGVAFERLAQLRLDPFPMQIMDPVVIPTVGVVSPWFAGDYREKERGHSWGLLVSADGGRTWEQRTVEGDLPIGEWPTELCAAYLGEGRILIVARCEGGAGHQFQIVSTDYGRTWKRSKTNITDVLESTPSLIYDRETGLVSNYYYQRGARKLKRRVVRADFIFDRPLEWPEPEVLFTGGEKRAYDAGNVKATPLGDLHCAALYTGTETDTSVIMVTVPRPRRTADRVETRLVDWTCDGERVTVPHTWNAVDGADGSGAAIQDADNSVAGRGYLRCSRTYRTLLPEPVPARRYFLRCEGAAITAAVNVNGRTVGRHEGPVTGFTFEITGFLRAHDNELEIVVDNHFDGEIPPIYGDYTVCGGLYRPVTLIETDPVCVDPLVWGGPGVEIETEADGTVRVKTHVSGADDADVSYAVNGQVFRGSEFKVKGVEPWSPESPRLYDLTVTVRKGTWRDTVRQAIGFRTAEFRADGFYLNGRRRQLRGVNYHQEREGRGWALDEREIAEDLSIIRRMGADAMRGTHYPHSRFCYDECDRLGILTWIEFPASSLVITNARYVARLRDSVRETVAQCRNHPSTLVWSLANELYSVWDGQVMPRGSAEPVIRGLQDLVKSIDRYHPTALAAAYAELTELNAIADVAAFNAYPGWYGESSEGMARRIEAYVRSNGCATVGIGEYGGGASVHHHSNPPVKPEPGSYFHPEEAQTDLHRIEYGIIRADPRVWGSFIWMMFDAASDNRNEGDHKGVNDKGLVTRDHRTPKDAYFLYKANWNPEPMLHLCGKRMLEADADKVEVVGFSNVGRVTLLVNGREHGALEPDAVRCVRWQGVPLAKGVNTIELRAGGMSDSCSWRWTGSSGGRRSAANK